MTYTIQIEYAKQMVIDYQRDMYSFWCIPNILMDSISQSNKLFLFHCYLLTKKGFEKKWGIMWHSDGKEKYFLLGNDNFAMDAFGIDN